MEKQDVTHTGRRSKRVARGDLLAELEKQETKKEKQEKWEAK